MVHPNLRIVKMKFRKNMVIFFLITGILVIVIAGARWWSAKQFEKEVETLFSQPAGFSELKFDLSQLNDLPEPVQRYFKHVLQEGQPYINCVRLKHTGQFKTDLQKDWVNINGEQYFNAGRPGFVWKGTTSMFAARDMYINNRGRLVVSLFDVLKIVDSRGEQVDQGELLRWLGEGVWFPTNLLPRANLQWTPIDNRSAKLSLQHSELSVFYNVQFNEKGEITQLQTQRYMGTDSLETWVGKLSEYQKINNIIIPTVIEAEWKLKQGDYPYAKFRVTAMEYSRPEKF